jgi:hypothetical protein
MQWLMKFGAGLVVGLVALWGWNYVGSDRGEVTMDFVALLDQASLRRPSPEVFAARRVTLEGEARSAIAVAQASRLAWDLTVPEGAWVEAHLALEESAWNQTGDGVMFRIGVSFDGRYEELLTQVVNPSGVPTDRRWVPVEVALSPYAGRQVSLILNTGSLDTTDFDLALWGDIRLVTR